MTPTTLLWTILLPALTGVAFFLIPRTVKYVREVLAVVSAGVSLYLGFALFAVKNLAWKAPWLGSGIPMELRLYQFPAFILLGLSGFLFLIALYSAAKMKDHPRVREYYAYVFFSAALAFGAVLADNFVPLVFFWEGLLVTLYALISLGGKEAHRTATKAFLINGFCDFAMILGIGIVWSLAGTTTISQVSLKPEGPAALAFILMMIGAIGKAGAMPFHTWIPDAAIDAPVTFMAYMPAAFEKLLGIYLLARICLDIFTLQPGSGLSLLLMIIGAATIVLAVMMALVQKDLKRLLSYHAVSQVGYMILGIGTAIPIGIAGGIFHMINHAMYKSGLFLSAGSVEHRAGTTDLRKLGGLAREMPITAAGFTVCALAISGVWPLNGFVSKEMVFHGAVESGSILFAIAAWVGAVFTFASFLKAGHAVFFGKRSEERAPGRVKESPVTMLIPILILALLCITFGLFNKLPLTQFIQPVVAAHAEAGAPIDYTAHALDLFNVIAGISVACLILAFGLHVYGFKRGGKKAWLASEPIHHAPFFKQMYDGAEKRFFDLYEQGIKFLRGLSWILFKGIDRPIDAVYEKGVTAVGTAFTGLLRKAHNGHYANYLAWGLGGLVVLIALINVILK
ncbi:MAG TPA: proton-conducting transporter membrane subunit [Candidatus Aminicenantes bacterium]|nr:proton-conducting transporter membrane subunit [Acidobacteriota bacterium]MDD8038756.1 proton-conducting transporter membrane subunit [Acidobacteriota bacterium]HOU47919.1 proton-conducting transporter membrane subunit [Candidatus Aminicenantes bacterium]HQJ41735.1 proton-conducting transporter membrane subunit [Candidatus Aminicenantes bacterium]